METGDDPIQLVTSAAHQHVPAKPFLHPSLKNALANKSLPTQRPSIEQVLDEFKYQEWYREQPIFHKTIPARQAVYSDWNFDIPESIRRGLRSSLHVETLFAHQAQAIQSLNEGKNVIVSTSTASGKSLIYTLPFLLSLDKDKDSTAFFVFPTKALAQDQNTKLQDLVASIEGMEDVVVGIFLVIVSINKAYRSTHSTATHLKNGVVNYASFPVCSLPTSTQSTTQSSQRKTHGGVFSRT